MGSCTHSTEARTSIVSYDNKQHAHCRPQSQMHINEYWSVVEGSVRKVKINELLSSGCILFTNKHQMKSPPEIILHTNVCDRNDNISYTLEQLVTTELHPDN